MPSAIDPDKIPGKDIDPDAIESNASTIKTIAGSVRDNGSNVHLKWQGMAGVYEAPESGTLLGLMQPVSSQATTAGDNLEVVSGALTQFAADVRPIKAELDSLRLQAQAFRDEIAGGVQVRELNPAWVSTQGYYGTTATYSGYSPYSSSSTGGSTTAASDIPQYQNVTKEWHEVQEYVDRNNDLISQVNAQQVALWEAERTCANTIRALFGGAPLHAFESEDDPLGYGLNEIPEGTEMPWGAPVERTEGCGEATAKFVFKDFLWEGVIVGGVWGTIEGLGTLVLGYNPATGDWFSGDAYGAAWGNLGLLVASGVMNSPLLGPLMWADQGMEAFGGGGFLPQEVRDFKAKADEAALNTGKALIAWDKWADDPGTALGESVFNVGTILIPGGAAVTGVKTAGTAASVLSKMARVVDLVDPASLALNGVTRLGGLGLGSLDNIIGSLDLGSKLDAPHIEVYTATDTASAIKALDDWGVDMNSVTAHVDGVGNSVLEFPGGRIELPAGSFDSALGGVRAGDGGVDASFPAPVREPELVSAGGVRGETGPGPVNSIVDEAPVRTETGGPGESTVVRDPETTAGDSGGSGSGGGSNDGSGDGAGGGSDDGARPAASGSDEDGAGWTSGPEHRGDPVESVYGEPRADHGSLADEFAPPAWEDVRADVRDLVTDPEAPYGRGADGEPYTRSEWEQRYIGPDGYPRYPGNDGAVAGTRVEYTDLAAFRRDYGASFDRLGGDGGKFLSPEGIAFESRALPGGSLSAPYNVFHLGDELPARMKIEVSEIAPAFGQPGGGIQVRFLLGDEVLSIDKLINEYGVLDPSYRTPVDGPAVGASFDGLAAPVPGSPDVQALHAATLSPDVQRALIRHEYPGLLGINSSRFGDATGAFDVNCTRCVVALDRLFDGAPSSAMPVHTNGALVTDITSALGLKNSFQIVPDYASIVQQMNALPEGSRGIVLVERHTGIGHVFNVVHDGNGVVFLDAQSGRFATLENAARLRLLVTHTGSPS